MRVTTNHLGSSVEVIVSSENSWGSLATLYHHDKDELSILCGGERIFCTPEDIRTLCKHLETLADIAQRGHETYLAKVAEEIKSLSAKDREALLHKIVS